MIEEILDYAIEAYPNDVPILEVKLKHLMATDKASAYELFQKFSDKFSGHIWLNVVECFENEPQIEDIYNKAFRDQTIHVNEIRQTLGNKYIRWLYENKSLGEARTEYVRLIMSSSRDASLCKTLVAIETEQEIVDVLTVRQHFMLACLWLGKTDIGSYHRSFVCRIFIFRH